MTSLRALRCSDGYWRVGALGCARAHVAERLFCGALLQGNGMLWVRARAGSSPFLAFCAILPQNLKFSLNDLQNAKTPKLQNTSENNKATGLTSAS